MSNKTFSICIKGSKKPYQFENLDFFQKKKKNGDKVTMFRSRNGKIQLQKMTLTSRVHPFSPRHQCLQEQPAEIPLALTTNFLLKKEDAQPKKQCSLE
jgi:hypothetical protein